MYPFQVIFVRLIKSEKLRRTDGGCTPFVRMLIAEREEKFKFWKQWRTQEYCSGGGVPTNSVEDRGQRERGYGGGSPLVRGSGGSCNLVQEISFHIVKFS